MFLSEKLHSDKEDLDSIGKINQPEPSPLLDENHKYDLDLVTRQISNQQNSELIIQKQLSSYVAIIQNLFTYQV